MSTNACALAIPCWLGEKPAKVSLFLSATEGNTVYGRVTAHARWASDASIGIRASVRLFGWDLKEFADKVKALHATKSGVARLFNTDSLLIVCLQYSSGLRPRLSLGGKLAYPGLSTRSTVGEAAIDAKGLGIVGMYDGLFVEDSVLLQVADRVEEMIVVTKVDTAMPADI
jgi:hypothetical protein